MTMANVASRTIVRRPTLDVKAVTSIAIVLGFATFSVLAGLLASTGANVLTMGLAMILAAACLATMPPRIMLPILVITSCTFIGLLEYFGRIKQGLWIPYGLALLMIVRLPDIYASSISYRHTWIHTPIAASILAFISFVLFSIALNTPPALQVIAGGKNYLLLWIIFFVIAWGALPLNTIERMFHWLLWLAFIQFPFVLYQYFFVALNRSTRGGRDGVAWDAVVGTFGGDPMRGGASGTMAFFLIVAIVFAITLYRHNLAKWFTVALLAVIVAVTTGLAEIKIVVLLLPIGLFIVMGSDIKERPALFLTAAILTLTGLFALLLVYNQIHYGGRAGNFSELLDEVFGYSLDTTHINRETGELGRATAFSVWWHESFKKDLLHALFGYGPGATRSDSIFAIGELAKKFPFRLERSATVQMLWEIGLIGTAIYFTIIVSAIHKCRNVIKSTFITPEQQAILTTCLVVFVMSIVMWPYGREIIEIPAQAILLVVCLGYVARMGVEMQMNKKALEHQRRNG